MKRCPDCRRDYFDDSLVFCLDDGTRLLEGPTVDGPATAVMPVADSTSEAATRAFDAAPTTKGSLLASNRKSTFVALGLGALLITALLAWAGYLFYNRSSFQPIESIAVMPFANSSGNADIEYLSDGITESLINSLSKIPTLSVKARSSVFTYKGKDVPTQQIAKDLAVHAVLNGRVLQRGDQVVLNVELVDAGTGNQLWGEQYTRKITDLVQLQSEIARDVSGNLRAKLTGAEKQRVARNQTENSEAYQLYLRGRHHWNKRRAEDLRKSVEYFQGAIDADPTYALAHASLAEAYILIPEYGIGESADYYPKARAAATRALEIDDSLAEAHNALGSVLSSYDWKFAEAEAAWKKALELNPSYATGHQWYSEHLLSMSRFDEALVEMRRAHELDPLSMIISGMLGVTLRVNGRHQEAIDQLKKTIDMDPSFSRTHLYLAEIYQDLGQYDQAIDAFGKFFLANGVPPEKVHADSALLKNAHRKGGGRLYARTFAELIEKDDGPQRPPVVVLARYWGQAGEVDRAFDILENAYRKRDGDLLMLSDPNVEVLRSDPRYRDLIRRIGLSN